jgi:hypothetical protein
MMPGGRLGTDGVFSLGEQEAGALALEDVDVVRVALSELVRTAMRDGDWALVFQATETYTKFVLLRRMLCEDGPERERRG